MARPKEKGVLALFQTSITASQTSITSSEFTCRPKYSPEITSESGIPFTRYPNRSVCEGKEIWDALKEHCQASQVSYS